MTDTYKIKMKITTCDSDTLYIPIARGVINWSIEGKKLNRDRYIDNYDNQYISISIKPKESITLFREVGVYPPKPDINPNRCLGNNERFCKWREDGYIQKSCCKDIWVSDRDKVLKYINSIKKIRYSYPRTKYEYTDEVLENELPQDCLGYHGTLCAMLRCSGIPSVVDIGFRLTGDDKPHVWLWYYDRQERDWSTVDINDSIIGESINLPRMSVTLGTTHNINSHTVSYVQYFVSEKMLKGELKNGYKVEHKIIGWN